MRVITKNILSRVQDTNAVRMDIHAPEIAERAKPGQFVVLMVSQEGERIPLTIVGTDREKGTVTIIFQEVGLTTRLLAKLETGESLYSFVGPLGHATEIKNYGTVVLVGGGVGIAEILPVARALKESGNKVISILGARTKGLLILEEELRLVSDELYIATDDGSSGKKGFTTDVLKEILSKGVAVNLVYAVGPIPMMRRVADITKDAQVKTIVSLNALMVDATGMCGCCRVTIGGETKFSCVDGPEFDAHAVDWPELIKRNQVYSEQEKHICRLGLK